MIPLASGEGDFYCVPCMRYFYKMKVPNEPSWEESLAKDKGVHCEVESERS